MAARLRPGPRTPLILPAADYRPYAPPPPMAVYCWMGPYIGVNLGYQWGETTNNPTEPSGIDRRPAGRLQFPVRTIRDRRRRPTSSCPAPKTPSRRGNSPIPGSARCAAAPASPSTISCSTAPAVSPTAACDGEIVGLYREPHADRLDRRPRHGSRPHAELVGQDRISLHRLSTDRRPTRSPAWTTAWNRTCCGSA